MNAQISLAGALAKERRLRAAKEAMKTEREGNSLVGALPKVRHTRVARGKGGKEKERARAGSTQILNEYENRYF